MAESLVRATVCAIVCLHVHIYTTWYTSVYVLLKLVTSNFQTGRTGVQTVNIFWSLPKWYWETATSPSRLTTKWCGRRACTNAPVIASTRRVNSTTPWWAPTHMQTGDFCSVNLSSLKRNNVIPRTFSHMWGNDIELRHLGVQSCYFKRNNVLFAKWSYLRTD